MAARRQRHPRQRRRSRQGKPRTRCFSSAIRRVRRDAITNDLSSYFGLSVAPDGQSFVCIRNERARDDLDDAARRDRARPSQSPPTRALMTASTGSHGRLTGGSSITTEASGNPDIWIMNADGSRRVQLTSDAGPGIGPRVTSDGKYIVFVSDRDGGVRPGEWGSTAAARCAVRGSSRAIGRGTVSPDGKWVYYSELARGESRKVSIDGGTSAAVFCRRCEGALRAAAAGFHEPMPAPDGVTVAGHYRRSAGARADRADTGRRRSRRRSCRRCRRARRGRPTAKRSSTSTLAEACRI